MKVYAVVPNDYKWFNFYSKYKEKIPLWSKGTCWDVPLFIPPVRIFDSKQKAINYINKNKNVKYAWTLKDPGISEPEYDNHIFEFELE